MINFRNMNANNINSERVISVPKEHLPAPMRSMGHLLPTYSTVLKLGPPPTFAKLPHPTDSGSSFIPKQPPPCYSEVEGIWDDLRSMISCKNILSNALIFLKIMKNAKHLLSNTRQTIIQ